MCIPKLAYRMPLRILSQIRARRGPERSAGAFHIVPAQNGEFSIVTGGVRTTGATYSLSNRSCQRT